MRSFAILIAGCVLTVIAVQSFRPQQYFWQVGPYYRRINALANQAGTAELKQAQYVMMDSLLPRLPTSNGILVEKAPQISDTQSNLERLVHDQLKGIATPKARIGVFVVPPDVGHYRYGTYYRRENLLTYFAGVDDKGPYCTAVVRAPMQPSRNGLYSSQLRYVPVRSNPSFYLPTSNVLGPCVFWARYGAPGPHINQWLENGGYNFAYSRADILWDKWPYTRVSNVHYSTDMTPAARGCRAGRADFCIRAVADLHHDGPTSLTRNDQVYWDEGVFGSPADAGILAYAEQQYGTTSFEKFWKSDNDLQSAFAAAFGTSMGSWIQNIAQTYFGPIKATPRLNAGAILLSLLFVLTLCFVAARLSHKRQIL